MNSPGDHAQEIIEERNALRAMVAELEAELRKAEIERDRFRALILTALKENGGPIDSSDTIDFVDYVIVRRVDFEALETAIK